MVQWIIYYADGSKYTSLDGDIFNAPSRGVIIITQLDKLSAWRTVVGNDYFIFQPWGWETVDQNGLWDYLCDFGQKKVLFGRTILTEKFQEICKQAVSEAEEIYK